MKDRCKHGLKEGQCSLCAGMSSRVTCEETGAPVWFVHEHTNYIRQLAATYITNHHVRTRPSPEAKQRTWQRVIYNPDQTPIAGNGRMHS